RAHFSGGGLPSVGKKSYTIQEKLPGRCRRGLPAFWSELPGQRTTWTLKRVHSRHLNACSVVSEDTTAEWHQRTTAMVRDLLMARPLTMNGSYGVPGSGHGELFGPSASMLSLPPASM